MNNQEQKIEQQAVESQQPNVSPDNEINWKKFREERESERKEARETQKLAAQKAEEARALREAMEAMLAKPTHQVQEEREETEDERLDKKIEQKWAKKQEDERRIRMEQEQREMPQRLIQMHSDFHDVCSQENLDYLKFHHPEISEAFESSPDNINKWSNVYKAVKKLVVNPNSKKDAGKAEKNFSKPQSMSVPGATQTGDQGIGPRILDEKRKAENFARMKRAMKGV